MAFPPVSSLSVRGKKHWEEVKPPKERRSCLPVSLHHFLFVYLKISKSFSLQTEQSFIPFPSIFPSHVFLIIDCPTPFFLPFPCLFWLPPLVHLSPIPPPSLIIFFVIHFSYWSYRFKYPSLTRRVSDFKTMLHSAIQAARSIFT